jgi:diguanylate cyclase (GGDEF)-like protein
MSADLPRILLVDDNKLNLVLLIDMLQDMAVTPIIAESGSEALELASRHEFALIMIDVDMPQMNGYQVLNQLAADPKTAETPVIFMSPNLHLAESQSHSTILSPVDLLQKPINPELLRDKVEKYLALHERYRFLSKHYSDNVRTHSSTPEGMLALNREGHIVYANPSAVAMLRTKLPSLLGLYFETLLERQTHEVAPTWQKSVLYQACEDSKTTKVEHTLFWCGDGHKLIVSFIAYPLTEEARAMSKVHTLIVFSELQNQKYSDERLSSLVRYDPLTRLTNRDSFEEMTQVALESNNSGEVIGVLLWNLDHFDYINESLGQEIGNQLLKAIAQRLSNCLPPKASLARIGGDEFAMLLPALPNIQLALTTAHALLTVFKGSFLVGGHEIFVAASAGIATYPEAGNCVETLMRNADRALKTAKSAGRGRVEIYNNGISMANVANYQLATQLHQVLAREELFLQYKPVINLSSTRLCGVEAQLYWRRSEIGVMRVSEFQDIAEESGVMPAIGEWMLLKACENWKSWNLDQTDLRLRLRLSLVHLLYRGFDAALEKVMRRTGMNPSNLEFEISEANLNRDNLAAFIVLFKSLNARGIRIILDDFGSNYLTLATLNDVEFHGVKLGGNFLRSTLATPRCEVVLKSVIDIAHQYGAEVTAAEVIRGDQIALLRKLGCDTGSLFDSEFLSEDVPKRILQDQM